MGRLAWNIFAVSSRLRPISCSCFVCVNVAPCVSDMLFSISMSAWRWLRSWSVFAASSLQMTWATTAKRQRNEKEAVRLKWSVVLALDRLRFGEELALTVAEWRDISDRIPRAIVEAAASRSISRRRGNVSEHRSLCSLANPPSCELSGKRSSARSSS